MTETTPAARSWYRPMVARSATERHRVATTLELLFDLCFVVAVGQTAVGLHESLAEGHAGRGVLAFVMAFFAIWWAWLQFTWFASAYDTDDVPYRLAVLVQIAGGLVIAAGVPSVFAEQPDFTVVTLGYVLMRLAGVSQWLRAAWTDPARRTTALRFAGGITVVQVLWALRLLLPDELGLPSFLLLAVAEMAVPAFAERAAGTTWHPHHIAERYGLFTIIVLGESVIGATAAVRHGVAAGEHLGALLTLAAAGLVLVFGLWWLYFDEPAQTRLVSLRAALNWGYGHYLIFASAAAVGAGIELSVEVAGGTVAIGHTQAALAITGPVAVYLLSVWLLQIGPRNACRPIAIGFPVAAVLVLAATLTPVPVPITAVLVAALVAVTVLARRHERAG